MSDELLFSDNPELTLTISNPKNHCEKHGEHDAMAMTVTVQNGVVANYPFCPMCAGEALAAAFPVVTA